MRPPFFQSFYINIYGPDDEYVRLETLLAPFGISFQLWILKKTYRIRITADGEGIVKAVSKEHFDTLVWLIKWQGAEEVSLGLPQEE